jgi:hypothetical protein
MARTIKNSGNNHDLVVTRQNPFAHTNSRISKEREAEAPAAHDHRVGHNLERARVGMIEAAHRTTREVNS